MENYTTIKFDISPALADLIKEVILKPREDELNKKIEELQSANNLLFMEHQEAHRKLEALKNTSDKNFHAYQKGAVI